MMISVKYILGVLFVTTGVVLAFIGDRLGPLYCGIGILLFDVARRDAKS